MPNFLLLLHVMHFNQIPRVGNCPFFHLLNLSSTASFNEKCNRCWKTGAKNCNQKRIVMKFCKSEIKQVNNNNKREIKRERDIAGERERKNAKNSSLKKIARHTSNISKSASQFNFWEPHVSDETLFLRTIALEV